MGRLDDQAKKRIVVLRKAGLSLRKIKKVLELDNIKVTPQAIYLFLKRKNIEPEKAVVAPQDPIPKAQPWEDKQLWNLLQDNNGHKKVTQAARSVGSVSQADTIKEDGIKIVSVTSLSEGNHAFQHVTKTQRASSQGTVPVATRECIVRPSQPEVNSPRPPPGMQMAFQQQHQQPSRAKVALPPSRNPVLLVTKKIVDRAIHLQKKVISQNGFTVPATGGTYLVSSSVPSQPPTMKTAAIPCTGSQTTTVRRDASTQTSQFLPPRPPVTVEQFDSMRGELHRLTQTVQTLIDRQSRWEQEQHRQQQSNHQEVIQQIQQLGATLTNRTPQNCASYGGGEETPLPDFGHFKIELL
ncbi:uncharacterized protein LOC128642004 [Bombina bombina]|uniref:uncharacterized protein LOC128642004 n=1 Tax=Bombina bombina TaxID=8345 RepID=UPI00235AAB5E|nr:uncharacterized protein LOC128642004 [Bombina bombina]XP_053550615.1 uncharacterized protein LOC128642004 [Bombina bombina]